MRTVERSYSFLVSQFHQGRAITLELSVVIILIIDLRILFREKR